MTHGEELFGGGYAGSQYEHPEFVRFADRLLKGLGVHHDSLRQEIASLKHDMEMLMSTYADLVTALQADEVALDGVTVVLNKTSTVMTGILSQLEALKAAPTAAQIDATIAEVKGHIDALSVASAQANTAADAVTTAEAPPATPPVTPPATAPTTETAPATDAAPATPPATPPAS